MVKEVWKTKKLKVFLVFHCAAKKKLKPQTPKNQKNTLSEQTIIILVTLQGKLAETYNQGNTHNRIDLWDHKHMLTRFGEWTYTESVSQVFGSCWVYHGFSF